MADDVDVHRKWWALMSAMIEFQTKVCGCGLNNSPEEACEECAPYRARLSALEKQGAMP